MTKIFDAAQDSYITLRKNIKTNLYLLLLNSETANIPIALKTFLYEKEFGGLVRNLRTLRVSFGTPKGSFYATDGFSWRWDNLTSPLQAALSIRRGSNGKWRDPPRLVSLGIDEDFI